MWQGALKEGIFRGKPFEHRITLGLSSLRCQTEALRLETHCATSFFQEFRAMLRGLSRNISNICVEVKCTRGDISSTTAEERKRLQLQTKVHQRQVRVAQIQLAASMASDTGHLSKDEHLERSSPRHAHDGDKMSPLSSLAVWDASQLDDNVAPWEIRAINIQHNAEALDTDSAACSDISSSSERSDAGTTVHSNTSTSHIPAVASGTLGVGAAAPAVCHAVVGNTIRHLYSYMPSPEAVAFPDVSRYGGDRTPVVRSYDADASDRDITRSSSAWTSPSAFSIPPTDANFAGALSSLEEHNAAFVIPLLPSNTSLLYQFHEVTQELIARGLGPYISGVSANTFQLMHLKKNSTGGNSRSSWNARRGHARVLYCTVDDDNVKAVGKNCADEGDINWVVDVRDAYDLV